MSELGLFEAYGVEIEHMIVDAETFAVRPVADRVLVEDGEIVNELEDGDIAWSNELAMHVVELKTNGPAPSLDPLPARFLSSTRHLADRLEAHGCVLLPGAMHPFMNPDEEFARWPHDDAEIYAAFDRIFDCRGHGWSNLQSIHLNLPFSGDDELGRLHAAIRLVLPILPALAAASPYFDGRRQPECDARLEVYRRNAARVPFVSGRVIPERAFTRKAYEEVIFSPLYEAIRPHDPQGILQHEWLNARGAIVRFDRSAIEIRVIDAQEETSADLAVCAATSAVLKALTEQDPEPQQAFEVEPLAAIFERTLVDADTTVIDDAAFLAAWSFPDRRTTAGELWRFLLEPTGLLEHAEWSRPLRSILHQGPLARRLLAAGGEAPSRERLVEICRELSLCLGEGRSFVA